MKVSVIGTGAMGASVASGLIAYGKGKYEISASNPSAAPLRKLSEEGVTVTHDNREVVRGADVVVVAVKPWIVEGVLKEIKDEIDYERQTIVLIVAGVPGSQLAEWLERDGELPSLIIAMPNTAMSVARSMTFLVPVSDTNNRINEVVEMFDCLGETMVIDEMHLPAATALASCGIAYAMRYVRASVEGGVELGFKAQAAQRIVVQTLIGAAALLSEEGAHPESEIDKVTTPGGITIRGLNAMEHSGFTSAVINGLKASVK